jgi:ATP-binding cassette subfamily C (CFTR/MRP) protein 1
VLTITQAGYRRPLERNDVWLVPEGRGAAALHQKLEKAFKSRVAYETRFPLAWALYDTFKFDFWLGGVCQLLTAITQVMAPFTLRYLITFAQNAYNAGLVSTAHNAAPPIAEGVGYVIAISAMQVIQSFALSHFYYRGMLMGGEGRTAIIALAFDKSLKLSSRAKAGGGIAAGRPGQETGQSGESRADPEGWSNGRIMNLIATDAARVEQACGVLHLVWTSPVQIVLTVALLVVNLGYSSLAGVAVLVGGLYVLTKMMKPLAKGRAAINQITDRRVSLTQELLQGIRFVKYFSWETFFLQRLKPIRAAETKALQAWHSTKSAIGAVSMALPIFSNMAAFIVYSVTSHDLEPAAVFSSMALFNGLRTPMNWLPVAIGYVIDAHAALKRIEDFLLAEDAARPPTPEPELEDAVRLDEATFTWEKVLTAVNKSSTLAKPAKGTASLSARLWLSGRRKRTPSGKEKAAVDPSIETALQSRGEAPFRLENVTLRADKNELIGVIGSVGCGKTSLLSALASDMRQTGGSMRFSADRAYCPQYAWIQNASIRDNILFGKPYDAQFYSDVVRACALLPDFDALPDGDLTEIGERGITLSGGQKQRINIARAIYSDAGIILLDDPLSAVDSHVGAHIFNEAICGLLRTKCRFLATHQLHFISRCDRIVWMVDGRIAAVGTFQHLMDSNPAFAKLLAATGPQQQKEEEEEASRAKASSAAPVEDAAAVGVGLKKDAQQLMQEDVKVVDSVPWSVYVAWMRASGSVFNIPVVLLLLALFRVANIVTSIWLSWWVSNKYDLSRGENVSGIRPRCHKNATNQTLDCNICCPWRDTGFSTLCILTRLHHHVQRGYVADSPGPYVLLRHHPAWTDHPPIHERCRHDGQQLNRRLSAILDRSEHAAWRVRPYHSIFLLRRFIRATVPESRSLTQLRKQISSP